MHKSQNLLLFLAIVTFLSCINNQKKGIEKTQKDRAASNTKDSVMSNVNTASLETDRFKVNDLAIFALGISYTDDYELKEGIGFISLSDYFSYSNHPDSLVIPKQYLGRRELSNGASFLELTGSYRDRFLGYNHKKETDSIFIFSCELDSIFSFQLKEISIVAFLSPYFDADANPITQDEFTIGFELNKEQARMLNNNRFGGTNFVYVGKNNPFVKGKIKPVLWRKVDNNLFPKNVKPFNPDGYEKYPKRTAGTFKFETDSLLYFVQSKILTDDNKSGVRDFQGRHFVVINQKDQTVVYEQSDAILYEGDEGSFYLPDSNVTMDSEYFQWTGAIFKNKPPIIYFNDSQPFGCPNIYFMDSNEPPVYIGCDNRH